jgi:hypothetical protein
MKLHVKQILTWPENCESTMISTCTSSMCFSGPIGLSEDRVNLTECRHLPSLTFQAGHIFLSQNMSSSSKLAKLFCPVNWLLDARQQKLLIGIDCYVHKRKNIITPMSVTFEEKNICLGQSINFQDWTRQHLSEHALCLAGHMQSFCQKLRKCSELIWLGFKDNNTQLMH